MVGTPERKQEFNRNTQSIHQTAITCVCIYKYVCTYAVYDAECMLTSDYTGMNVAHILEKPVLS